MAADWSILPAGSEVMINGNTYIVEDRGGAIQGNVIDVFVGTEAESIERGVFFAEVFVKE
ncbi:3D domain-containing protein [Amedibacillus dolichus]|uniref:3D domain-containing protein n=1 Tax=Amedibacillus dolichus TaxID=31971 RepID=UPI001D026A9D|nr:3D domain-containing protein [Amedibacillus dolichus]MCB5374033.1 3D domain-containing protein [Amedibacillus dolichus]